MHTCIALHHDEKREGEEGDEEGEGILICSTAYAGVSPYHDYQSSAISHRFKLERVKQTMEEIKDLSWRQK